MLPAFLTSGLFILYIRYLHETLFVIAKHPLYVNDGPPLLEGRADVSRIT